MSGPSDVRGDRLAPPDPPGGHGPTDVRRAPDAGAVTAELAVAVPAVVLVLLLCLAGIRAGVDHVRCVDAAHLAARALARGDAPERVRQLALRAAPAGAQLSLSPGAGEVVVTVRATAGGWGGVVPSWELNAAAAVPSELGTP